MNPIWLLLPMAVMVYRTERRKTKPGEAMLWLYFWVIISIVTLPLSDFWK